MSGDKSSEKQGLSPLALWATIGIICFGVGLPLYLVKQESDRKKEQEAIALAMRDYRASCVENNIYALADYTQQEETSAILRKAGISPELFYLNQLNLDDVRSALISAGLVDEFRTATEKQDKAKKDAEVELAECKKKQASAEAFLRSKNALGVPQ